MDIQVGDKVTYKYLNTKDKKELTRVVTDKTEINNYKNMASDINKEFSIQILKIERPKYEVIEEKKNLLTEKEKQFLKDMIKWYSDISAIIFSAEDIDIYREGYIINCPEYPDSLEFKNIIEGHEYTLEELGLE